MKTQILSIRDFSIIYNLINQRINELESYCNYGMLCGESKDDILKDQQEYYEKLKTNIEYQDLIRIREQLENLNVEIKTPDVKVNK